MRMVVGTLPRLCVTVTVPLAVGLVETPDVVVFGNRVEDADGNVIVVPSVPLSVSVLLNVSVLLAAPVRV